MQPCQSKPALPTTEDTARPEHTVVIPALHEAPQPCGYMANDSDCWGLDLELVVMALVAGQSARHTPMDRPLWTQVRLLMVGFHVQP